MSATALPDDLRLEADSADAPGTCAVKLPAFEGPLDLLLHLIRINEVEITEIPIASVGQQYLEYLDLMDELDIDVAGEYLLMAATLAWIKSRMLLPPDGEEEGDELDPRSELIARLLEYQRYKEVAGELGERSLLGRDVFEAHGVDPPRPDVSEREIEVGLFELLEAFRRALKAAGPSGAPHEIEVETVTVRERMIAVMDLLKLRESLPFDVFLRGEGGQAANLTVIVATFLAILELARLTAVRVYQSVDAAGLPSGPIHLRCVPEAEMGAWSDAISDIM
jgi:segregation and condensation protein A